MAPPNIPADFDFLDPDVNLAGLPVDGARRAAQVRADPLGRHPERRGRLRGPRILDRHQARRRQGGVARSDVFSSWQNGAIPTWPPEMKREQVELQRSVMLNMDAPHHTRLRKIISRGFTPRAIGRLEAELAPARPEHRQDRGDRGQRRLRRAGVVRAAAAGHRGPARRSPGGSRQALPLVQRDDRRHGPRVRRRRSRAVVDGADHVRDGHGR